MRTQPQKDIESELLSRTFDYLVNNGLENISMRDLCKFTGISIGSIYYWFDNKDELIIYAAEYGLSKVADNIFNFVFDTIDDLEHFFNTCLGEITKYRMHLRLIYQIATSPHYGENLRKNAETLNSVYYEYAKRLSHMIGCSVEDMEPLVYMFISVVLDYVIWEDLEKTQIQINKIYQIFKSLAAAHTAKHVI
ncbi:MAG: TetR/AcrR family transcriptional regulator [Clostridia bacterium]|nr:TetR/AcrR family transcriptional regulator [Clostridia bacterium]